MQKVKEIKHNFIQLCHSDSNCSEVTISVQRDPE